MDLNGPRSVTVLKLSRDLEPGLGTDLWVIRVYLGPAPVSLGFGSGGPDGVRPVTSLLRVLAPRSISVFSATNM